MLWLFVGRTRVYLLRYSVLFTVESLYWLDLYTLTFFWGSFMLFLSWCLLCFRACLFIDALWSPAGKGLTS